MHPLTRRSFLSAASAALAGAMVPRLFASGEEPAPAAAAEPVAPRVNQFGLDLYGEVQADRGNVFLSPFSVSTALAMTAAGARGATLDEMVKVLRLPADPAKADAGFRALLDRLKDDPSGKRPFQLSTANAVWAQQGYPWRPEFKARVAGSYGAGLREADFLSAPEPARAAINAWVEKETREKIRELLAKGTIDRDTRMVLTNAVYFKGDWAAKFDRNLTKDALFTGPQSDRLYIVPLMHRQGEHYYAETTVAVPRFMEKLQLLDLPYAGGELAMLVVLPRDPGGVTRLAGQIDADTLADWFKSLRPRPVRVYLPRFKVETEYNLNDPLKALGMKAAFSRTAADFRGMHSGPEQLFVSLVVHKAYADVNEEGTEAAASTGVVIKGDSAPAPQEPVEFRADRPFLFLIRHVPTGAVLFLGRYEKP
jgi:serpin B